MNRQPMFVGVDVQTKRPCAYFVLDSTADCVKSGWFKTPAELLALAEGWGRDVSIGIDAPRAPLRSKRRWYWSGSRGSWRRAGARDRGFGRHCEIVVKAYGLANPQWTPPSHQAPSWMRLGFRLFGAIAAHWNVYEVFPAASYRQFDTDRDVRVGLRFTSFSRGPRDMLDACIAAVTVREFQAGRGCAVGNGDGLGQIILPRPLSSKLRVLQWPEGKAAQDAARASGPD